MSKKTFKKSMALGALMAFVITGTAFAAVPTDIPTDVTEATKIQVNNGYRYYGVKLETGTKDATIGAASYVVDVQEDATNGGVFAFQLDSNGTKLTFTDNATFSASTNTTGTGNNQLTALSVYDGQVTVKGDVTATANATGENGKSAYGISLIGGEGCEPIVNLNGESVNVTVTTETARDGKPVGSSIDYCETAGISVSEGTFKTGASTNTTINVTGNKAEATDVPEEWGLVPSSPLYGINVEAGKAEFGGTTKVNVTDNGDTGNIIGVNIIDGYYTSTQSGSGKANVTLNNAEITVIHNGEQGTAYGILAHKYTNDNNYEAIIDVKGNLKVDVISNNAYSIDVWEGKKAILGSEATNSIILNATGNDYASGLYAYGTNSQIDVTTKDLIINSIANNYTATSIETDNGAAINITANKATINGMIFAGSNSTLDISGINELVLTDLAKDNIVPAIYVEEEGTLKVNTQGTIAIEGAEAGNIYNVAAGNIKEDELWARKNIAYDRTEMFAVTEMGIIEVTDNEETKEVDLYKINYKAFEDLTEEELAEAKAQMVSATGGEAVGASKLVASAIGGDLASAPGAKELLGAITSSTTMTTEAKAEAINAATKLAEASGNTSTVVNVANSISGATTGRLSFNGGNEGGYGPDLYDSQENAVTAVWAQYVHGKDKATDMPSTAGTS
ncbi:MAG: hypothetical protein IKV70_07095, partial [Phascolarctobacterium sp.]|nr:hypothetical protein [Phascolarctobacterium sp.]